MGDPLADYERDWQESWNEHMLATFGPESKDYRSPNVELNDDGSRVPGQKYDETVYSPSQPPRGAGRRPSLNPKAQPYGSPPVLKQKPKE